MALTFITKKNKNVVSKKVSVILLAENHGNRMKSKGPISLVDTGGKRIIEHQIEAIDSSFKDYEIVLCGGFGVKKVYNYIHSNICGSLPVRIVENQLYYHSNCCEGMRICLNNINNDKIVVCGGDILLTKEYLKSIKTNQSSILSQQGVKNGPFEIGIIEENGMLSNFSVAVRDIVWAELLFLSGHDKINSFYEVVSKPELKTKFLFEAINAWDKRGQLAVIENRGKDIVKINSMKTLKRLINENNGK